jgi:hypothetical protein
VGALFVITIRTEAVTEIPLTFLSISCSVLIVIQIGLGALSGGDDDSVMFGASTDHSDWFEDTFPSLASISAPASAGSGDSSRGDILEVKGSGSSYRCV